jgi:hypothetical protein
MIKFYRSPLAKMRVAVDLWVLLRSEDLTPQFIALHESCDQRTVGAVGSVGVSAR